MSVNLNDLSKLFRSFNGQQVTVNAYALSSGITLSYIAFYTAYSKANQTLDFDLLKDFFFLRKGTDWTLKEANKVISLSGLTSTLLAFLPEFKPIQNDLLFASTSLLWAHAVYSFYSFYDFSLLKVLNERFKIKTFSVALGIAGQALLTYSYFGKVDKTALAVAVTGLGVAHFWTMEVDYKYKLQVRPFAYLPFPLSFWAIYKNIFPN